MKTTIENSSEVSHNECNPCLSFDIERQKLHDYCRADVLATESVFDAKYEMMDCNCLIEDHFEDINGNTFEIHLIKRSWWLSFGRVPSFSVLIKQDSGAVLMLEGPFNKADAYRECLLFAEGNNG